MITRIVQHAVRTKLVHISAHPATLVLRRSVLQLERATLLQLLNRYIANQQPDPSLEGSLGALLLCFWLHIWCGGFV